MKGARCKKRVKTWPLGLQADWILSGAKRLSLEALSGEQKISGTKRLSLETLSDEKILRSEAPDFGNIVRRKNSHESRHGVRRKLFLDAKGLNLKIR